MMEESSNSSRLRIAIDQETCVGCGLCADVCTRGAIEIRMRVAHMEPALCDGCGECVTQCPEEAIYAAEILPVAAPVHSEALASLAAPEREESGTMPEVRPRGDVSVRRPAAVTIAKTSGGAAVAGAILWLARETLPRLLRVLKEKSRLRRGSDWGPCPDPESRPQGRSRRRAREGRCRR